MKGKRSKFVKGSFKFDEYICTQKVIKQNNSKLCLKLLLKAVREQNVPCKRNIQVFSFRYLRGEEISDCTIQGPGIVNQHGGIINVHKYFRTFHSPYLQSMILYEYELNKSNSRTQMDYWMYLCASGFRIGDKEVLSKKKKKRRKMVNRTRCCFFPPKAISFDSRR